MMERINNFITRKWFYLFLIPFLLFIAGSLFVAYHVITYDTHFTVMPIVQKHDASLQIPQNLLVDGEVVKGEFKASMNNMGAIALRIKNLHEDNVPDNFQVFFRIKEKSANKWYSTNSYSGGQFHDLNLFPFGFPLIADSKDKIYTFEIFTKRANKKNALTIDTNQHIITNYQLEKSELKKPAKALEYIKGKVLYLVHDINGIFSALIYYLPLYAYFYLLAEKEKIVIPVIFSWLLFIPILRRFVINPALSVTNMIHRLLHKIGFLEEYETIKSIPLISLLLFIAILISIFFIDAPSNFLLLVICVLWGISVRVYKLSLRSEFLLATGFLVLALLLVLIQADSFAAQSAIWSYLFLIIGSVHAVLSLRKQEMQ